LGAQLQALIKKDQRLQPVLQLVSQVPLRLGQPGFAGLAKIVSGQLLSVASASAIHNRVEKLVGEMSSKRFLAIDSNDLREVGLSWSKINCLRGLAEAEINGEIDFEKLHHQSAKEIMQTLTSLKGIGPWSAEIYLVSSVAHPDIFPAGDLVLQKMLGKIYNLRNKPDEKQTRKLSKKWAPYRGSAARLLWRYFAVLRGLRGINL